MNKKHLISYFRLLFTLLAISFTRGTTQASAFNRENKTCVYDTIWTYETVFDTVWVYDTLFVDEAIITPQKLPANPRIFVNITNAEDEFVTNLIAPDPGFSDLSIKKPEYQPNLSPSKNVNKTGNHFSDNRQNVRLTLNPFQGKFEPSVFRQGEFSLEAYCGINFQNLRYRFLTDDSRNTSMQEATKPLAGFDYGLHINYHLAQLTVQTGLGWSSLRDQFNYSITNYEIDSTFRTTQVNRMTTFADSVWVLDPNWSQQGDSAWIYQEFYYDSLIVVDSVYYLYDTTRTVVPYSEIVSHNLLEVPLIFSWHWKLSNLSWGIRAGAINQLHLFSVGKAYSDYNTVGEAKDVVQFSRYNIALYGGISGYYSLSRRTAIGLEAWYKYPLLKFEERFNASVYRDTYGLSFSFRYYLTRPPG